MPQLRSYDLFISHSWKNIENSEYYRLVSLLDNAPNFNWRNYSVPEHDPFGTWTDNGLKNKIYEQIRQVSCFIIISGMYVNYRKWIQIELEIAQEYGKPIIGIVPFGQERTPVEVQNISKEMVNWNTNSIVEAIRKHAL